MYVRLRKNVSGSISVFIVDSRRVEGKLHAKSIMVKSFGSSSDPEIIKKMAQEAETYKLLIKDSRALKQKALIIEASSDLESCTTKTVGFHELYGKIFQRFFASTHLPKVNNSLLSDLVCLRIANPVSKLRTARDASNFGVDEVSVNKIYKFMDCLNDKNIEKLKKAIYKNTKNLLGDKEQVDILFYDLTTIYFETNKHDEIRNFGFSKDGKHQHVQITMALIVTKHGLPIGYELFPGNMYEGHTLIPVMKKLRSEYKIDKVSVVADSALMNEVNLKVLEQNNFTYIISARVRNLKKELTDEMLNEADYVSSESDIKYKVIKLEGKSLILVHSAARSRKDAHDLARSIEKAMKHVGSSAKGKLSGSLKKPYFTLSKDCQIVLDEKKILEASQFDGYFGFYTNLDMKPEEVISQYKGLWQVEQTFRITKHNIKIRPVYHWNQNRIKAHFAICFVALSIMRFTEVLLKRADNHTSLDSLHNMLEQVQSINIISKGEKYAIRTDMTQELLKIYRILGINKPENFTPIP